MNDQRSQKDVCPTYPWYVIVESLKGIQRATAINGYTAERGREFIAGTDFDTFSECYDAANAECGEKFKAIANQRRGEERAAEVGGCYKL